MGRGRGVSYGGGQSSLSYLFGGGGGDEPAAAPAKPAAAVEQRAQQPAATPAPAPAAADAEKQKGIPAGVRGSQTNNYFRAQGQNCGNFLTVSQSVAGDLFLFFPFICLCATDIVVCPTA
jgi:SPIRAL1-like protein